MKNKKYFISVLLVFILIEVQSQTFCGFDNYYEAVENRYSNTFEKYDTEFKEFIKLNRNNTSKNTYNTIRIPVVFHIVHNGEIVGQGANISDSKIQEQLQILNRDFTTVASGTKLGFGSATNPKFEFCMAQTNPFGQTTNGITRTYGKDFYTINTVDPLNEDRLLKSINWNPLLYLNIYVTDLRPIQDISNTTAIAGYSSMPIVPDVFQGTPTNEQNILRQLIDGIVLNYRFIGKEPGRPADTDGHVLTHEVGHWLGLFHVFNEIECDFSSIGTPDCLKYGDKICDTPIIESPSLGNTFYPDEEIFDCLGNLASAENFMDYNTSLDFFTEKQVDMMHQKTSFYRGTIYNETFLNYDCTLSINDFVDGGASGGNFGESGSCNGTITDNYAFKITSDIQDSGFGKILSLNGNKLVVSNPGTQKLNFFNIDECSVVKESELGMENIPVVNLLLTDNFLFVATLNADVLIFEINDNKNWTQIQQINSSNMFGINMKFRDNTFVVTGNKNLSIYEFNGNNFTLKNSFSVVTSPDSIDVDALQFNGEIIAIESGDNRIGGKVYFYAKNSSGSFWEVNSNVFVSAETIVLTDAPENYLYAYRFNGTSNNNERVITYDLSSLTQGENNIIKINEILNFDLFSGDSNWNNPLNFHVYNNYLLMLSNRGISFHNRETTNLDLVNVYDGDYNSYLQPNPFSLASSLSKGSNISGNFLAVPNSYCGEIYIYRISDFLDYSNSQIDICTTPISDYLEGKTINIGGNNCNVEISKNLNLLANETITMNPGTHVKSGVVFSAKTGFGCDLNGGIKIDMGLSSKSNKEINEIFYHNPIQIKIDNHTKTENNPAELSQQIKFEPNPTKGFLRVISNTNKLITVTTVTNLSGSKLLSIKNIKKEASLEFDLSNFSTGVFIINFQMEDGSIISKKIIKE